LAVALVAGAVGSGVAVHRVDVHRSQTQVRTRLLLHLLGGSATLTLSDTDSARGSIPIPDSFDTPLGTDFGVSVRNDSAQPLEISNLRLRLPGVDVVTPAPDTVVPANTSATLTTRIAVHCNAKDLPQYPSGVTVTARTISGKDKATATSAPTDIPLTFTPAPTNGGGQQDRGPEQAYTVGADPTGSFYHLCGDVLTMMPADITATAITTTATTPQSPQVSYRLHIESTPGTNQVATPAKSTSTIPGVTAETDLKTTQPIGPTGLDVTVTDHITDCTALGTYLLSQGGAGRAAALLNEAAPFSVQPADPRFRLDDRLAPSAWSQGLFDVYQEQGASLQEALVSQLAAACPEL